MAIKKPYYEALDYTDSRRRLRIASYVLGDRWPVHYRVE